jgi:hypothetical protein
VGVVVRALAWYEQDAIVASCTDGLELSELPALIDFAKHIAAKAARREQAMGCKGKKKKKKIRR